MVEFYLEPDEEILCIFQNQFYSFLNILFNSVLLVSFILYPAILMTFNFASAIIFCLMLPILVLIQFYYIWDEKALLYFTTNKVIICYPHLPEKFFKRYKQKLISYNDIDSFTIIKSKKIKFLVELRESTNQLRKTDKSVQNEIITGSRSYDLTFKRKNYDQFVKVVNLLKERTKIPKHSNTKRISYYVRESNIK